MTVIDQIDKLFNLRKNDLMEMFKIEAEELKVKFAQNNMRSSGIAIKEKIELYKKQLGQLLDVLINVYFEVIGEKIITEELSLVLQEKQRVFSTYYIDNSKNSIKAYMHSCGLLPNTSIFTMNLENVSSVLIGKSAGFKEILLIKINQHNNKIQEHLEKRFTEEYQQLEEHQKLLMFSIVEAHRSLEPKDRCEFVYMVDSGGSDIIHPGFQTGSLSVSSVDIKTLRDAAYVKIDTNLNSQSPFSFYPTLKGIKYYEYFKKHNADSFFNIENEILSYLESSGFARNYTNAFEKWKQAERLLWETENSNNLSTIGHLCREAVQEFAESIINRYGLGERHNQKVQTKNRLKVIIDLKKQNLGETTGRFYLAYLDYWDELNDLIQRLEHAALKEGEKLVFEDARRVVFHTAILFYEISKII